jgi:two-component system phosphate regulon sensor histidine kinase PhoR
VVSDVVDSVSLLAKERGVTFRVEAGDAPAVVTGDRDELMQVVQNLVDNAVKYSPADREVEIGLIPSATADAAVAPRMDGAFRLSLLTPDRDLEARYAVVTVRDHGPGMAREHLPRLAERFYRVEGQKSGERPGTGLGLAIVKHITNRHRGGLAVESVVGEGALFSAYFPLAPHRAP